MDAFNAVAVSGSLDGLLLFWQFASHKLIASVTVGAGVSKVMTITSHHNLLWNLYLLCSTRSAYHKLSVLDACVPKVSSRLHVSSIFTTQGGIDVSLPDET